MKPHCNHRMISCFEREIVTFSESPVYCALCLLFVSSAVLNEAIGEAEALSAPLTFAEEIKLLASSGKVETSVFDSLDRRHV